MHCRIGSLVQVSTVLGEAVTVPFGTAVYCELDQRVTSKKKEWSEGDLARAHIWKDVRVGRAELWGTVRSFDAGMRQDILRRVERTGRAIAESAGASVTFELDPGYPVTVNHEEDAPYAGASGRRPPAGAGAGHRGLNGADTD